MKTIIKSNTFDPQGKYAIFVKINLTTLVAAWIQSQTVIFSLIHPKCSESKVNNEFLSTL